MHTRMEISVVPFCVGVVCRGHVIYCSEQIINMVGVFKLL